MHFIFFHCVPTGEYQQNLCNPNTPGCIPCPQRLFSCVGSPNGANGIEGNSWVPDYIECYKNRTMGTKKCGGQKVFDPLKRECAEQSPCKFYLVVSPITRRKKI